MFNRLPAAQTATMPTDGVLTMTSSHPAPQVLVLGAAGRFGAAATQAFAQAGWQVLAQVRRADVPLPPGVQRVALPLSDTAGLARAAQGARAVVYAVNPLYTRWGAELLPLARQGMAVAQALGARFMLPGNVYNHGSQLPATLSEGTPQQADTPKGRQRLALEAALQAAAEEGRLQSTVIRAGDFYGGGTGSWLDLVMVKGAARGKLVYPGPLDRPHAWAYLPDLARAFVAAAGREGLPPFAHWHFAGHTLTGAQWLAELEAALRAVGVAPPQGFHHAGMPWGLIRLLGIVWPMGRELARMAYLWERPHALDDTRLQRELGPLPGTPVAQALRQALADLGLGAAARPAQPAAASS
jgi:nucleoside-diphosphate-sugar epimerase